MNEDGWMGKLIILSEAQRSQLDSWQDSWIRSLYLNNQSLHLKSWKQPLEIPKNFFMWIWCRHMYAEPTWLNLLDSAFTQSPGTQNFLPQDPGATLGNRDWIPSPNLFNSDWDSCLTENTWKGGSLEITTLVFSLSKYIGQHFKLPPLL